MDRRGDVSELFDAEAPEYASGRERQYSFQKQKRIVLEMLRDARGRILDAGCGPALMAPALLELGFEVWGLDAAPRMIELGLGRIAGHARREHCHLATGDIAQLGFADGFFDAIVSMGVLEYLPDYAPALAEMSRALRPGGVAVLTVSNGAALYHLSRRALHGRDAVPSRCIPWRLDRQLAQHALRRVASRSCNFIFYPLHDKLPRMSLALNRLLWPLSYERLGCLAGTQYIVKAQKLA